MHYVCIENNTVVAILNYLPSIPNTVRLQEITDPQANQLRAQTHYFDVADNAVKSVAGDIAAQQTTDLANAQEREFLNNTDWKILRHIRQKALNIATSLSDTEYIQLEQQREAAAARVVSQQ